MLSDIFHIFILKYFEDFGKSLTFANESHLENVRGLMRSPLKNVRGLVKSPLENVRGLVESPLENVLGFVESPLENNYNHLLI